MKKKILKLLAVTAAAACVVGVAGCSSSDSGISIDSFWYIDSYSGIQNSAIGTEEVLKYDISFAEGGNSTYHVTLDESKDHSYTTKFGIGLYNWDSLEFEKITQDNKDDYKDENGNYKTYDNKEYVYYLETELVYSGSYVYGSTSTAATADNSVAYSNTITTTTYFRSARNKLTPVYSYSYVHSFSPNAYTPTGTSNMCVELEYEMTVYYNQSCTQAYYSYEEGTNNHNEVGDYTKTVGLDSDYTLFDNNEIYTAIRGMNLSSSFSETVSLLIPADGGITNVAVSCSTTGTLDATENSAIYNALVNTYDESKTTDDDGNKVINYNEVSITNAADTYSGVTQTAWYAAVEDENDNQYRATLLYLAIPMSYDLGTLEYTLTEVADIIAPDGTVSK